MNQISYLITIVCSTKKKKEEYESHVINSCGLKNVDFIYYENKGDKSLTQLYNEGLKNSKSNIVVFIHDDIDFSKCKNWGKTLLENYKKNPECGIFGVAGTTRLTETGVWWENRETLHGIVWHSNKGETYKSVFSPLSLNRQPQEVVCVDGVFFSCDKTKIKSDFDETFKGFHFYDISFCVHNFLKGVKIYVHNNIEIIHKSIGITNKQWEENRIVFSEKFKKSFPIKVDIDFPVNFNKVNLEKFPKISMVILTKERNDLLFNLLDSISEKCLYKKDKLKLFIADTGSKKDTIEEIKQYIKEYSSKFFKTELIEYDYYNFAKINNDMVFNHIDKDSELILFSNNDVELINDSISHMVRVYLLNKNECGTVGCRLNFEDGYVQHLGLSLSLTNEQEVNIAHFLYNGDYRNYQLLNITSNDYMKTYGNTAGFMITPMSLFLKFGGFNETYQTCYEDVEYNIKLLENKYYNYTSVKGVCYHFESQTRDPKINDNDVKTILNFISENTNIHNNLLNKYKKNG